MLIWASVLALLPCAGLLLAACGLDGDQLFGEPIDAAVVSATSGAGGVGGDGGALTASSVDAGSGVGGGFSVAASQAASSSVGATSSATGGMEAMPCEPKPTDKDCSTCIKSQCCAELEACNGDPTCTCMLVCTLQKKLTCYSECKTNFNQQPWVTFSKCRTTKCALACL
ncbi:MAG: hypothetical protein FJ095_09490 [Deltaproteobacteria bacterium]|nr:hypothetical protein [Deltaproteobacteria bacterium]